MLVEVVLVEVVLLEVLVRDCSDFFLGGGVADIAKSVIKTGLTVCGEVVSIASTIKEESSTESTMFVIPEDTQVERFDNQKEPGKAEHTLKPELAQTSPALASLFRPPFSDLLDLPTLLGT